MNATAKPLHQMVQVGYAYITSSSSQKRTGTLVLKATSIEEAKRTAKLQLGKDYDWFKLTKVTILDNDNPQQQL